MRETSGVRRSRSNLGKQLRMHSTTRRRAADTWEQVIFSTYISHLVFHDGESNVVEVDICAIYRGGSDNPSEK